MGAEQDGACEVNGHVSRGCCLDMRLAADPVLIRVHGQLAPKRERDFEPGVLEEGIKRGAGHRAAFHPAAGGASNSQ